MSHLIPLDATFVAPNGFKKFKTVKNSPRIFLVLEFYIRCDIVAPNMTIRCDNVAPNSLGYFKYRASSSSRPNRAPLSLSNTLSLRRSFFFLRRDLPRRRDLPATVTPSSSSSKVRLSLSLSIYLSLSLSYFLYSLRLAGRPPRRP